MKHHRIAVVLLTIVLCGFAYAQDAGIQTSFISINDFVIPDDFDYESEIDCGYENLVKGKTENIPEGWYLWLVLHPDESSGYWPQGASVKPHPRTKTWTRKVHVGTIGTDIGKMNELWAILVDDEGNDFYIDYLNKGKVSGDYPEIELPKNSIEVDMIKLIKRDNSVYESK